MIEKNLFDLLGRLGNVTCTKITLYECEMYLKYIQVGMHTFTAIHANWPLELLYKKVTLNSNVTSEI